MLAVLSKRLSVKLALTYSGGDGVVALGGGLYWMQHRIYSATQARFLSVDPVQSRAGSTQSAYNYTNGDPVNFTDPTGAARWECGPWWLPGLGCWVEFSKAETQGLGKGGRYPWAMGCAKAGPYTGVCVTIALAYQGAFIGISKAKRCANIGVTGRVRWLVWPRNC
jgi:RHS repeat-associated protein